MSIKAENHLPTSPFLISDKDRIWFHFQNQTLQKKLSCKFSSNLNFTREALAILSNPFAFATCNYSAGNFTHFRGLNFNSTFHPEISQSAAALSGVSSRLSSWILQSVLASFHSCDISAQGRPRLWRLRDLSLPRWQWQSMAQLWHCPWAQLCPLSTRKLCSPPSFLLFRTGQSSWNLSANSNFLSLLSHAQVQVCNF